MNRIEELKLDKKYYENLRKKYIQEHSEILNKLDFYANYEKSLRKLMLGVEANINEYMEYERGKKNKKVSK